MLTAAAGATTAVALADPSPAVAAVQGASFVPDDAQLHLLRRATYGPTPASIAEIRRLGVSRWLERQLHPATIADPDADALMARFPLAGASVTDLRRRVATGELEKFTWAALRQVGHAAVARAIWSERQLFEIMVDFWSNHLNVSCTAGDVWDSRADYDRNVIRRHALGRFSDLLKASARHPAMLTYLDNRFSTKAAPNENYGRELLELHTIGLPHSESDVRAAARLFTGLTVDGSTGAFRYNAGAHATGVVASAGFRHLNRTAGGGQSAALAFLDHLALRPATAARIATKLCLRFVSDVPPPSLVKKLAAVYLAHRSDLVPVLRALFTSPEFAASAGAKVRTPYEDVVATVRVLGYGPEQIDAATNPAGTLGVEALHWTMTTAGHAPLAWPAPNGYPDVASAWASPSGQLIRWNAHLNIAAGWWPRQLTRPKNLIADLIGPVPTSYGGLIDALARRLLGRTMKPEHRAAVARHYGRSLTSPLSPSDQPVTSGAAHLVALILNTPYFGLR